MNNVKLKSDSSTQTLRRSNPSLTGEEKVIWRLRSRICDPSLRFPSDGFSTPVSQINSKKQKVPIKVVTQSPGLISPRRPPDSLVNRSRVVPVHKKTLINNNNSACLGATINPSKSQKIFIDPPTSSSEGESGSSINVDLTSCVSSSEKRSALSKVVAIATAVPTHVRPSEGKVKGSNGFNEEPTLLTAGWFLIFFFNSTFNCDREFSWNKRYWKNVASIKLMLKTLGFDDQLAECFSSDINFHYRSHAHLCII